jgi:phage FluMu protein Com
MLEMALRCTFCGRTVKRPLDKITYIGERCDRCKTGRLIPVPRKLEDHFDDDDES